MPFASDYDYSEQVAKTVITKKEPKPSASNAHLDTDSYATDDSTGANRSGPGGKSPGNGASVVVPQGKPGFARRK